MEWKRLRNKYLNLQREMVREMKKQAYFRRMQMGHPQINNNIPAAHPPLQNKKRTFEDTPLNEEGTDGGGDEAAATSGDATKSKRRKRGREKIKEAIKKSSHIYFEG